MTADSPSLAFLATLQPIRELGEERLKELKRLCYREMVGRGLDPLRVRSWTGQAVYLAKGELRLEFADGSSNVLVGGTGEALNPLGKGVASVVRAKAITDVELIRFDEDMLDIMLTWDQLAAPKPPASGKKAPAFDPDSTDWRSMSGLLAARSLTEGAFAALPPAHIESLLGRFERLPVKRGEVVVAQGGVGDYYYLIESGRALVTRDVAGAAVELAELNTGDAFGEEALVSESPRNATVAMRTDGTLLRLRKEDFVELLREPLLQRLSWEEARQRIDAGAQWVDVRFAAEFQLDGLPGAINIPLNELRQAIAGLPANRDYVVYCQSGRRSSAAAFLMCQKGVRAAMLRDGLRSRQGSRLP